MDVERRLAAFRRKRRINETFDVVKNYISTRFDMSAPTEEVNRETSVDCDNETRDTASLLSDSSEDLTSFDGSMESEANQNLMGLRGVAKYVTYFCLWALPFILFIKVGFGAVYFCVTALIMIYFNTRTGPKLKDEPSAYSVFNRGCEPIEGALSADQLEREVRQGLMG